ncbi:thioesterase-like superfamily-domain-containing protein [Bombardia bombarda]|uniref:Thioesterase-like superfamily-domain-containing protein n=1 Tax=Bombardia bombarda TaxID=252184 RepID=A0AA40CG83_9PEZI|nr:thioesterase-like superfamily-domain-containing protein [Bombardia bombarda]
MPSLPRLKLAAPSCCGPLSSSLARRALRSRPTPLALASSSSYPQCRPFSVSTGLLSSETNGTTAAANAAVPPPPPTRWIADLRARVGHCVMFGCSTQQVSRAAAVLRALATEWRTLLAGSEGFLTGGRRGLDGQRIAWGEMDSFGHVNNVNYYRYAESARVNWITNFSVHVDPVHRQEWAELMSPKATGLIMRSLKADFKFVRLCPMVYPDKISVYHKLRVKPEGTPAPSAFMLDCIVLSHQHKRVAAKLEEDIVVYDYKKAGKTSMPPFMVDLFHDTYRLQQDEMIKARTRIWDLIEAVRTLEKETWDREDAVEDVGSTKGSA